MRSKTILVLALALGLGLATSAMAAIHTDIAYGVVAKADSHADTLWIRRGNETTQFTLAADATVMRGNQKVALDSLKLGERVKVEYTPENGARLAEHVLVSSHHHHA